jgi:hypothetical protein
VRFGFFTLYLYLYILIQISIIVNILEDFLGSPKKHAESSGQVSFDCPACAEDKGLIGGDGKGNLEINYEKNVFKCWACADRNNMHGTIPKLIKRYGNESHLKNFLLLKPNYNYSDKQQSNIITNLTLPEGSLSLSSNNKHNSYDDVIKYIKKRNVYDLVNKFDFHYTSERLIIPSYDEFSILNYYVGRSIYKKIKPKYLNPDADKTQIIFNEKLVNWDDVIFLVEGAFDHIVVPNSIPLLGKYLNDYLLNKLYYKSSSLIVILLDSDAYEDALFLYKKLNFGDLYGRIRICVPPYGYDPSRINERLGREGIKQLLKSTYKLNEIII